MSDRIIRQDEGGLSTLTLNRPDKLNALDTETFEALAAHLDDLEAATETIGCIVLRGKGRAFCAGADLGAMNAGMALSKLKPQTIERLSTIPQPIIAAVHGVCFTGGLELAMGADLIVADATARFADTHGKWGLVGTWGISQRLPRRIGVNAAKLMMFTAREVSAGEANEIGLIDVLTEEGKLDETVAELTGQILANSWFTNFANKRIMRESDGMSLADGLSHEHYRHPGFAPDFAERVERFSKKK